MTARFEVLEDSDQHTYWFRLKAANGEVVAQSQAYQSLDDVRTGMAAVKTAAAQALLPGDDGDLEIHDGIHMHF